MLEGWAECQVLIVSFKTRFGWSLSGEMSSTAAKSALKIYFRAFRRNSYLHFFLENTFDFIFDKQHGIAYG